VAPAIGDRERRGLDAIFPELRVKIEAALAALGPAAPPGDELAAALAERFGAPASWGPELGELRWPELILALACCAGRAAAIAALERDHIDKLVPALAERGAGAAEIDELLQDLRTHLLVPAGGPPRLTSYSGRGSLRGFLRSAAIRMWLNKRRGDERRATREELGGLLGEDHILSPELAHMKALYLREYQQALRAAWAALDGEQRLFLRHHLVDGMSIDALASLYAIHRSSAARRIAAARDALIAESKRYLARELGLPETGVTSVLRLIRSRLEIDLDSL
jgi:RNA polymerase sigma-70 factor (ECF subfamily)